MSTETPGSAPPQQNSDKNPQGDAPQQSGAEGAETEADKEKQEEHDRPQDAWSARRDLVDHSPKAMGSVPTPGSAAAWSRVTSTA